MPPTPAKRHKQVEQTKPEEKGRARSSGWNLPLCAPAMLGTCCDGWSWVMLTTCMLLDYAPECAVAGSGWLRTQGCSTLQFPGMPAHGTAQHSPAQRPQQAQHSGSCTRIMNLQGPWPCHSTTTHTHPHPQTPTHTLTWPAAAGYGGSAGSALRPRWSSTPAPPVCVGVRWCARVGGGWVSEGWVAGWLGWGSQCGGWLASECDSQPASPFLPGSQLRQPTPRVCQQACWQLSWTDVACRQQKARSNVHAPPLAHAAPTLNILAPQTAQPPAPPRSRRAAKRIHTYAARCS